MAAIFRRGTIRFLHSIEGLNCHLILVETSDNMVSRTCIDDCFSHTKLIHTYNIITFDLWIRYQHRHSG